MKLKLKIMNIFYFVISAVALFFLATQPFFSATVDCNITYELVDEMIDASVFDEFGISAEDLFSDEEQIDFTVDFKIDVEKMLAIFSSNDADDYVKRELLAPAIEPISEDLDPVLRSIARNGVRAMVFNTMFNELDSLVPAGENFYDALEANGYSENDVNVSVDDIVDIILAEENGTLTDVADAFANEYNKYAVAIDSTAGTTSTDAARKLKPYLQQFELIDDKDNLQTIDEPISSILQTFIDAAKGDEADDEDDEDDDFGDDDYDDETDRPFGYAYLVFSPLMGSNVSDDQLTNTLVTLIYKNYFEGDMSILMNYIVLIFGVVMLVFMATWIVKILQFIICLFRKTPYIRIDILGIISCTVQVLLSLITLGSIMISALDTSIISSIPILGTLAKTLPIGIRLGISFSAFIPGILAIVNLLYSIVYGAVKKKFKKDIQREKDAYIDIE